MKLVKGMALMAMGAGLTLILEHYGTSMIDMASNMMKKCNCSCDELDN